MAKLRLGIIGAGGIARRRTIPALIRAGSCDIVAVMSPTSADEVANEFGLPRAYASLDLLLDDPLVEAVYIASPVYAHAVQIEAAAKAGKHVLCEKPLTRTLAEADCAIAACRTAGVVLQEGYMMRFHGAHRAARRLVEDGRIGRPVYLRAQLSCWYPPIAGAWRQDPILGGGGALIDMASHCLDLLSSFAGPVRRIVAFTRSLVQSYASEDASTLMIEFEGGALGTVDCVFCTPDAAARSRLEIHGSRGCILGEGTIGQDSGGKLEAMLDVDAGGYDAAQARSSPPTYQPIPFDAIDPYAAQFEQFAECVRTGTEPPVNSGSDGRRVLAAVMAAYASSREGRVMDVADWAATTDGAG